MKTKGKTPYKRLHEHATVATLYSATESLLSWDQDTYMPDQGIAIRSLQIEAQASLVHKQKTGLKFVKLLSQLIDIESGRVLDPNLSSAELAAVKEWRRDYLLTKKLPNSFVKAFAKTSSKAMHVWADARKKNDFTLFAPHLEKIVSLSRKKADYLRFQEHPYDALLDLFEPGTTTAFLTPLFAKLKISLTDLLKKITAQPVPRTDFLEGEFSTAKQLHFGHQLLKAMGFEPSTSRLDQSAHPFCTGLSPKDTRMTTHIHPDKVTPSIFAVLHEGGHGLYNMGLPEEHFGSPLCASSSLAIDESQSRFWETIIGHSHAFWEHFLPRLQHEFPEQLASISLDTFYRAVNLIKPSLIRIHADEVTYSLHIILRYEIEKALMDGSLKVKEIPDVWNQKMRDYIGIVPPNNAQGCLQDIHWSMGGIGYFPTYALGNMYGAQFLAAFESTHPTWRREVAAGNLTFVRTWLWENIHRYGKEFSADELCKRVTGKPLSQESYIHYLTQKYSQLYGFYGD